MNTGIQTAAVIREYNTALQDGLTNYAERIRKANKDILGHLDPGEFHADHEPRPRPCPYCPGGAE